MTYLLKNDQNEPWESFFNYVIVDSKKPAFFAEGTVLRKVEKVRSILICPCFVR